MIFKLTAKNCRILAVMQKKIDMHLAKLNKALDNFNDDLVVLRLTLRKEIDKYYPLRSHPLKYKTYASTKPALSNFQGSINFRLGKNWIYAQFKGQSITECIDLGFHRIFIELEKYKHTHFSSESKYPDHFTIRGI